MPKSLLFLLLAGAAISADGGGGGHTSIGLLGSQASSSIVKHLSSALKWPRSPTKTPQSDADAVQFESGYLVETLVDGNGLGMSPHTIRVSPEGELFAVDSTSSNIVKITPPLSQYSRARLVAGSFQGYSGHVDGKPSDARFNRPRGVAMDGKGNVYVADTGNLAVRKIGEAGVTTIAGGKSSVAGYRDGPSEDAKFSSDFDVVYMGSSCSLLVVDRGNAALRQILLQQEDCDHEYTSVSTSDVIMVIGAILAGYILCLLQHGFGPAGSQKKQTSELERATLEKRTLVVESLQEDPVAGWPSFGRLISDLLKLALEAIGYLVLNFIPSGFRSHRPKKNLTPLKDRLVMPEDKSEPPLAQKQISSPSMPETLHAQKVSTDAPPRSQKSSKLPKFKDPSLSGKHRSSKKQDFAEFYAPGEAPQLSSKIHKERPRHRHRDKSGEVFGAGTTEPKPVEMKATDYGDSKYEHYNMRSKYGADNAFSF